MPSRTDHRRPSAAKPLNPGGSAADFKALKEDSPRCAMVGGTVRTVGALLLDSSDHVLLGLRADWKNTWPECWDCIGGHLEAGETLAGALSREVQEEIGVRPTAYSLLGAVPEQRPDLYGDALHHIFLVTAWDGGPPENTSDEHSEIRWFEIGGIAALNNLADRDYGRLIKSVRNAARSLRTAQRREQKTPTS